MPVDEQPVETDAQATTDFEAELGTQPTEVTPPVEPAATPEPVAPELEFVQVSRQDYEQFRTSATKIQEVSAALEKLTGTTYGRIGGLERALKERQAETPAGQAITLTDEDFAEMTAEFPEFASMQRKTMERILSKLKGTGAPAFDDAKLGELVHSRLSPEVQKIREESSMDLMDSLEPDWRTLVNSPEYQGWMAQQSQEYQKQIAETWKPAVLRQSISKFRTDTKPVTAKPPAPKGNRFATAVVPRGAGGHTPSSSTEEDDFNAALK